MRLPGSSDSHRRSRLAALREFFAALQSSNSDLSIDTLSNFPTSRVLRLHADPPCLRPMTSADTNTFLGLFVCRDWFVALPSRRISSSRLPPPGADENPSEIHEKGLAHGLARPVLTCPYRAHLCTPVTTCAHLCRVLSGCAVHVCCQGVQGVLSWTHGVLPGCAVKVCCQCVLSGWHSVRMSGNMAPVQ